MQTGFGRTGTNYWGFQNEGVMPDIVTLAKGIGNGFPLAAVVTTPEIAAVMSRRFAPRRLSLRFAVCHHQACAPEQTCCAAPASTAVLLLAAAALPLVQRQPARGWGVSDAMPLTPRNASAHLVRVCLSLTRLAMSAFGPFTDRSAVCHCNIRNVGTARRSPVCTQQAVQCARVPTTLMLVW